MVSAGLFAVAGFRDRNWLVVSASLVFGLACVLFLMRSGE